MCTVANLQLDILEVIYNPLMLHAHEEVSVLRVFSNCAQLSYLGSYEFASRVLPFHEALALVHVSVSVGKVNQREFINDNVNVTCDTLEFLEDQVA